MVSAVRSSPAVRGIVASVCLYAILWAYGRREQLSARGRLMLGLGAAALASLGLAICVYRVVNNFISPPDWDFLCFWTYGRALAQGQSPYDVAVLREIAAPHTQSAEFLKLNYCCYPPVCLPLFWGFGYLSFPAALVAWQIVQVSALVGCIELLRRFWDESRNWLGLLVTLAVVLSWHATLSTLFYAQTTFLLLGAILLSMLGQSPARRGIWLGLAILVKPIAAILAIDFVIRRQWRALLAILAPLGLALGLFLLAQGWPGLMYYKDRNPIAGDVAFIYYSEAANQSLLGVLLRWFDSPPLARPIFFPPFVLLGGLLTAVTLTALVRLPHRLVSLGTGYLVTLALLVYPGSLMHYPVLLLIPVAMLWRERNSLPGGPQAVALTIAIVYGLDWSRLSFAANLATWAAFTVLLTLAGAKRSAPATTLALAQPTA